MRKLVLPVGLALGVVLAGCGGSSYETVRACATLDSPPIAVNDYSCQQGLPAVRWYESSTRYVGPDDAAVPGEELDGDWYDVADQLELDENKEKKKVKKASTKKASTKPRK